MWDASSRPRHYYETPNDTDISSCYSSSSSTISSSWLELGDMQSNCTATASEGKQYHKLPLRGTKKVWLRKEQRKDQIRWNKIRRRQKQQQQRQSIAKQQQQHQQEQDEEEQTEVDDISTQECESDNPIVAPLPPAPPPKYEADDKDDWSRSPPRITSIIPNVRQALAIIRPRWSLHSPLMDDQTPPSDSLEYDDDENVNDSHTDDDEFYDYEQQPLSRPTVDVSAAERFLFSKTKPKSYDEALDDYVNNDYPRGYGGAFHNRIPSHRLLRHDDDDDLDALFKDPYEIPKQQYDTTKRWYYLVAAGVVAVVMLITVSIGLTMTRTTTTGNVNANVNGQFGMRSLPPRPGPPIPPPFVMPTGNQSTRNVTSVTWTSNQIKSLLQSIVTNEASMWDDPASPQGKALQWILDNVAGHAPSTTVRIVQRYVLAILYFATSSDTDEWVDHDKWLTTEHECLWFGIRCGRDGSHSFPASVGSGTMNDMENEVFASAVTYINLSENNLHGSLPREIAALRDLAQLHLQTNFLTGTIPETLPKLMRLHTLFLDGNMFVGTIPSTLGNMDKLSNLDLSNNSISGTIPNSIGNLMNLADLRLSKNDLTGAFPLGLVHLKKIEILTMGNNEIQGTIPKGIGSLSHLVALQMYANELFGTIPAFQSTRLELLHLDNNVLTGPIPRMSATSTLRELRLERNQIQGSLPLGLGDLAGLDMLWLQFNSLTGSIPQELGQLEHLKSFIIIGNNLTGSVPTSMCELRTGKLSLLQAKCYGSNEGLGCSCCDECS